jgi:hypothetical protein
MNLAAIRTAMYAQADWSPDQSPQARSRVTGFINRAYNQLALEAPFLFFEDKLRVTTEPDVASASDSDTLIPATTSGIDPTGQDPWVFKTTYTKTVADANATTYTTTWKTDRSWDGRIIEFELADGTFLRNQIRTIWLESDVWHLTLVRPFNLSERPTNNIKFRIYTEAYAFPDDLIELRSMRLTDSTQQYPLNVIGQDEAEELILVGPRDRVASGIPRIVFRREHFQLEGPGLAPRVALNTETSSGDTPTHPWKGPEPPGEFEYVVTYTWGKRDAEFRLPGLAKWDSYAAQWSNTDQTIARTPTHNEFADNRVREPRYESAPSPASEKIKIEVPMITDPNTGTYPALSSYPAITLIVPNIEYALGFLTEHSAPYVGAYSGERVSQHQSGIHVRIYRRRVSTLAHAPGLPYRDLVHDAKGLVTGGDVHPDNKQKFYLLAEMRIDELNSGRFIDDGQYIPDRSRPLRDTHGYQQYGVYPRPDARYEVDVRCLRRPQKLVDEQDAPRIHAEATDMLINRAMAYLYESMGDYAASQLMMTRYEEGRQTLAKRYGDLRPVSRPVLRRMTRARPSGRSRGNYRKWNTVISEGDI